MKRRNQGIVICLMALGLFALFDGCEKQPEYNWVKRITDYKPEVKQYWELEYDNRGRLTKLGNTPICYDGDEVKVGSLEWNSRNEKLSYATYRKMDDGVYTCLSECFVNEDSTSRNMLKETTFRSSGDTIHVLAYYKGVENGQVLKEVSSKYVYDDRRRLTDVMNSYLDAQGNETWACHSYYTYEDQYDFDDDNYCEDCYHRVLSSYGIHPYDFKPNYHFLEMQDEPQLRNDNLHVGIELEIQGKNRNNFCDVINNFFDNENIYLKMDGSLNSKGIEIISMPMTFKYLTEGIDWKYCFDELNLWQMNDTEDCGLHFHLDRNYLSADNIRTIDYIVNNFSEYFMSVGGREFSYYCQKRDKSYFDWGKDIYSRYSAVNLENTSTVELRFFKSTYNYETFIQRIKIVFAIVQFSKMYIVSSVFGWSNTCFMEKFNNLYKTMFGDYPNLDLD